MVDSASAGLQAAFLAVLFLFIVWVALLTTLSMMFS